MPYTFEPSDTAPLDEKPAEPTYDRRRVVLSESQVNQIAEKAADLAVKKVTDEAFKQVGKRVIEKFLWIVGVAAVALFVYLTKTGAIK